LPGGFVDVADGEKPEDAARRELKEETNLDQSELKLVTAAAGPDRDPRG
jgi:8-oxo-dGTP diphosphatase